MRRLRWLSLGLVALVMLLLAPTLWREREQLMSFEWHIAPLWLVVAFVLYTLTMGWSFIVWHLTMRRMAGPTAPGIRANFAIYFTSLLARRVPGSVWYAASKVLLYEQLGVARSVTVAAVVLEIAIIFVSGVLFFLLWLPLVSLDALAPWLAQIPAWLPPLGIIAGLVILWPGVLDTVINRVRAWRGLDPIAFQVGYRDLMLWVAMILVTWLTNGLALFAVTLALYRAPLSDLPTVVMINTLSVLIGLVLLVIPFLPLAKEFAMTLLLTAVLPLPVAIVVTIVNRVGWTLNDALWALVAGHMGHVAAQHPEVAEGKINPSHP